MKYNIDKAKEIYINNFGSTFFMKRNGEYKTYVKCKVPKDVEREWCLGIISNIKTGLENLNDSDLVSKSLFHLCYIDISFNEKCNIIAYSLENKSKIEINEFKEFIKSQKTLYSDEFLSELNRCIVKVF